MSVQTEIDRLASAKAAIKAAIEGKGVTVPDATLLDGMAALIEGIEAGGARACITGTKTPVESVWELEVNHNLGVVPNFYLCYNAGDISSDSTYDNVAFTLLVCPDINEYNSYIGYYGYAPAGSTYINYSSARTNGRGKITDLFSKGIGVLVRSASEESNNFYLCRSATGSTFSYFVAGNTYRYIIGKMEL